MTQHQVVWEDPPAEGGIRRRLWEPQAAALKAHPKRWGIIADFGTTHRDKIRANQMAQCVRVASLRAFEPRHSFEAASRNGKVYARYVG